MEVGTPTRDSSGLADLAAEGAAGVPSSVSTADGQGDEEMKEDDDMCRYCFGGRDDGPLISPCLCAGGQKVSSLNTPVLASNPIYIMNRRTHTLYAVQSSPEPGTPSVTMATSLLTRATIYSTPRTQHAQYVHLDCLRRWQRMVLVSQPTHPMFYEDDIRHHKCNVCMGEFTCPPPTRAELMESFTG